MWDLISTMDDATSEHYSMFFVEQEGTFSSFRGVRDVIAARGLFGSFYSDRGSHYWHTPEVGGKVDKENLTQFGRALKQLGIDMIAAYSPEAAGRSERAFGTHQGRLPQELALAGNHRHGRRQPLSSHGLSTGFQCGVCPAAMEDGSAFVPWIGGSLDDILSNTMSAPSVLTTAFASRTDPADTCGQTSLPLRQGSRRVNRYGNGALALFHGPRGLAYFTA